MGDGATATTVVLRSCRLELSHPPVSVVVNVVVSVVINATAWTFTVEK
jgi:hypothetical protein